MLVRMIKRPLSPVLAGAVMIVLFLAGTALLSRASLADPVTYVLTACLGVGFAMVTAWRRRREHAKI